MDMQLENLIMTLVYPFSSLAVQEQQISLLYIVRYLLIIVYFYFKLSCYSNSKNKLGCLRGLLIVGSFGKRIRLIYNIS